MFSLEWQQGVSILSHFSSWQVVLTPVESDVIHHCQPETRTVQLHSLPKTSTEVRDTTERVAKPGALRVSQPNVYTLQFKPFWLTDFVYTVVTFILIATDQFNILLLSLISW